VRKWESCSQSRDDSGGRALKFYASVRLDVRKVEVIRNGTEIVGTRTKVKVVKNKVAPPFKEAEFDIIYGEGISKEGCIVDMAVSLDIIDKSGAWFAYNGQRIGQGRDNTRLFLKANKAIRNEIEAKVRETFATKKLSEIVSKEDDDEDDISDYEKSQQEIEWDRACSKARSDAISYIGYIKKTQEELRDGF